MKYITLSWKVLHLMNISGTTSASFQAHCVDNSNTAAWAYTCRGLLTKIQVNQCWLWSVWLFWLLDFFLRSVTRFDIPQSLKKIILTYVWVFKNSSSVIIILGKSHFSNFKFYTYSPTHSWCTIWWVYSAAILTILITRYTSLTPILHVSI